MKIVKWIIILFNLAILYIAYRWYSPENPYEPVIVIIGQLISLITLCVDQSRGNTTTERVERVGLDVDTTGHANVTTKDVKDSTIKIKKR